MFVFDSPTPHHRKMARVHLSVQVTYDTTVVYVHAFPFEGALLGRVQTESKSEIGNRNDTKQGADWSLGQNMFPFVFRFRGNE